MRSFTTGEVMTTGLSPFGNTLEEWIKAGHTHEEWLEAGRQKVKAIQESPHFHDWIPCADWHRTNGK